MYYEINVSLHGVHFFATAERSCRSTEKTREVYNMLREKFPASEGYDITVTHYTTTGTIIDMENKEEK